MSDDFKITDRKLGPYLKFNRNIDLEEMDDRIKRIEEKINTISIIKNKEQCEHEEKICMFTARFGLHPLVVKDYIHLGVEVFKCENLKCEKVWSELITEKIDGC